MVQTKNKRGLNSLDDLIFMLRRANWGISKRCVRHFADILKRVEENKWTPEDMIDWMFERYAFSNGRADAKKYYEVVLTAWLSLDKNILKLKLRAKSFLVFKNIFGVNLLASLLRFIAQRKIFKIPYLIYSLVPPQYLWCQAHQGQDLFQRDQLKEDVTCFIREQVPKFHAKYPRIDSIILFSGGPDSLLTTIKYARENKDQKILLLTVSHDFIYGDQAVFLNHFKDKYSREENIVGHEILDVNDLFDSLGHVFRDQFFNKKLRPCIPCKLLMVLVCDILLRSYQVKDGRKKFIITGYRGPEHKTFFPQTKRFDPYAQRCALHAKCLSPIWDIFDKADILKGLKASGVEGYNRYKGVECCGPLTWDMNQCKYGWNDFVFTEEVVSLINSLPRE